LFRPSSFLQSAIWKLHPLRANACGAGRKSGRKADEIFRGPQVTIIMKLNIRRFFIVSSFAVALAAAPSVFAQGALGYVGHGRNVQTPKAVAAAHAGDLAEYNTSQLIRAAINADGSLSSDAHNVQILTLNGHVTLSGPVASDDEKSAVVAKAEAIVGDLAVADQLYVPQTTDSFISDQPDLG
jgi:hyperosmotically inducible periplasmic protein